MNDVLTIATLVVFFSTVAMLGVVMDTLAGVNCWIRGTKKKYYIHTWQVSHSHVFYTSSLGTIHHHHHHHREIKSIVLFFSKKDIYYHIFFLPTLVFVSGI